MASVSLYKVGTPSSLSRAVTLCLKDMSRDAGVSFNGKRILIKPNMMGKGPLKSISTSRQVIFETVSQLKNMGARQVCVGEGSFEGWKEPVKGLPFGEVLDFNRDGHGRIDIENIARSSQFTSFSIPAAFEEADVYINMPVIKTHFAQTVTLSLKNNMGLLSDAQKKAFHFKGIANCLWDLNGSLKEYLEKRGKTSFVLADGLTGMEGNGPAFGTDKPLGILVAGLSPEATDIFIAEKVMGADLRKAPLLQAVTEKTPNQRGDNWELTSAFIMPSSYYGKALWPPCIAVSDKACCGCSGTLHALLKSGRLNDLIDSGYRITAGITDTEIERNPFMFAFGNCAAASFAKQHIPESPSCITVRGCPPQFDELSKLTRKK